MYALRLLTWLDASAAVPKVLQVHLSGMPAGLRAWRGIKRENKVVLAGPGPHGDRSLGYPVWFPLCGVWYIKPIQPALATPHYPRKRVTQLGVVGCASIGNTITVNGFDPTLGIPEYTFHNIIPV